MSESAEFSSRELRHELQEIKERLTTIEGLDAFIHRDKIVDMIRSALKDNANRKAIVKNCDQPRTKEELASICGHNSVPALDHHLTPLREHSILIEQTVKNGCIAFVQSRIIRMLPKSELAKLLG